MHHLHSLHAKNTIFIILRDFQFLNLMIDQVGLT